MTNLLGDDNTTDLPPEVDETKDYYQELVGDGRKFKDNQALARSKFEADQYIEILKRRLDESRQDYLKVSEESKTRASLEELLKQYTRKPSNIDEPQEKDEMPQFDPKQIDSLVETKMQAMEMTRKQENNFNSVRDKLQQRYGSNYKATVAKQIEELGITETELNDLARRQPKILIKTLGLDKEPEQQQFQTPPRSARTDNFAPKGAEKRTWAYYQNLKKTNPEAWFDRKTAVQMQEDAIALGEAFKDGDYYRYGQQ